MTRIRGYTRPARARVWRDAETAAWARATCRALYEVGDSIRAGHLAVGVVDDNLIAGLPMRVRWFLRVVDVGRLTTSAIAGVLLFTSEAGFLLGRSRIDFARRVVASLKRRGWDATRIRRLLVRTGG